MRALAGALIALALAACAPGAGVGRLDSGAALGPMAAYDPGPPRPLPPMRANAQMVEDFLELGFMMESGRSIPQFSRFEGPVRVVTEGTGGALAERDLDRLIARLRAEAAIDIARAPENRTEPGENRIVVSFVPQRQMRLAVPAAACFVVPNVSGWEDFLANRRSPVIDWTRVAERRLVTLFVPVDSTPQEVRDCLHEELAQALGPLNDLYRLPDSVFNDDNFQTTLTGFDMLILRVWNAPELRPGMTRGEVAARLPALFNRLNPAGRRSAGAAPGPTPRPWIEAVEYALSGQGTLEQRQAATQRAVAIARAEGWNGPRLALSLLLSARLAPRDQGDAALLALLSAADIYRSLPGGEVHAAHLDLQLAVQALAAAQFTAVIELTGRALPLAQRTENAALEASLAFLRAEALAALGQDAAARQLRLDTMAAARYGFGSETAARARMEEAARLGQVAQRLAQR
jgi:hypothetical protein